MGEFEFVVAEEYKFKKINEINKSTFWKLRTVEILMHGSQIDIFFIEQFLKQESFRCQL